MHGCSVLSLEAAHLTVAAVILSASDMSNDASSTDESAASQDSTNAQGALGGANSDIADYMSNVNSQLSAGNPYESQSYLQNQNLETSGAMDSEKDAADQELGSTVARTGTNSAALADTEAESARQGQRDLTQYTAGQNAANENSWLQDQQSLDKDQLAEADAEAGLYSTATGGQNSTLSSMTNADDAEDQMWAQLGSAAMTGAGAGMGGAFCWIAAELYGGWNDPRTVIVRRWIDLDLAKSRFGRFLRAAYIRFGERAANHIRTHKLSRCVAAAIFNRALAAGRQRYGGK